MIDLTTLIVGGTTLVTGICLASFGNARASAGHESLPGSRTGLRIDHVVAFVLILFIGCGAFAVPRTAPGRQHL
jgi:hypothetical protein